MRRCMKNSLRFTEIQNICKTRKLILYEQAQENNTKILSIVNGVVLQHKIKKNVKVQ